MSRRKVKVKIQYAKYLTCVQRLRTARIVESVTKQPNKINFKIN